MRFLIRGKVLLVGACIMAGNAAWGQAPAALRQAPNSIDVAVVYNTTQANIVPGNNFWMQGGSFQIHAPLWRGWGAVADIADQHTANMSNTGAGLDLLTFTFGPRYTRTLAHTRFSGYGQFLAGQVNGQNSVFPGPDSTKSSATGFAFILGGGINLRLNNRISLRVLEAGWLCTQLPNATTGVQNNLRLGAGAIFNFK